MFEVVLYLLVHKQMHTTRDAASTSDQHYGICLLLNASQKPIANNMCIVF